MPSDDVYNGAAATPSHDPLTRGAVLLVEDEAEVRIMCRRALELDGSTVLEAPDGVVALSLVDQWTGPLDLVITDMKMPRLGGAELAALLSVFRPDLPILAITGDPGMADRRLPALLKPFSLEELTEAAQLTRTRTRPLGLWPEERRAHARTARRLAASMPGGQNRLQSRVDLLAVALELQRLSGSASRLAPE